MGYLYDDWVVFFEYVFDFGVFVLGFFVVGVGNDVLDGEKVVVFGVVVDECCV